VRVVGFRVYSFRLPLVAPLTLAGLKLRAREGLLLELVDEDGASGWGEASPLPGFSRETLEVAEQGLFQCAARAVERDASEELPELRGIPPSARFGFETALWSLRAAEGRSLPEVLSPGARRDAYNVSVAALLAGTPEAVLEDALLVRRTGYRAVKLKVGGGTVEEDAELARAVAGRLGGSVALRLDANRAWDLEEAMGFLDRLGGVTFEYLEEPLARSGELGELVREAGAPVALDESLTDLQPEVLNEHSYAKAVVLKPTLLGLSRSLRFAEEATRLGMTPVVSAAYESGVGTAALVALAAALGDVPAGLDTYRRLADDVLEARLALPASEVDVRRLFAAPLAVDRGRLTIVGEGP
jgi:O-succinylbenzoate synthase